MKLAFTLKVNLFFLSGVVLLLVVAVASLHSTLTLVDTTEEVGKTHALLAKLENLLSLAADVETGARGYLVTGDDRYLEPYRAAVRLVDQRIGTLRAMLSEKPEQQERLNRVELLLREKVAFTQQQIDLLDREGFEAARRLVLTNRGKDLMDQIRVMILEMEQEENDLLTRREELTDSDTVMALGIMVVGTLLSLGIVGLALVVINRDIALHNRDETEKAALSGRLQEAVATINTLASLLPVCSQCRQVREDQVYREQLDTFLRSPSPGRLTLGTCPACQKTAAQKGAPKTKPRTKAGAGGKRSDRKPDR
jgi:CHASE3 domain sensor protein